MDDKYAMMVYYSGKDMNELGNYWGCNQLDGANYVLIDFMRTLGMPLEIGWCLPEQCSQAEIESFFTGILFPPESALTQNTTAFFSILELNGVSLNQLNEPNVLPFDVIFSHKLEAEM